MMFILGTVFIIGPSHLVQDFGRCFALQKTRPVSESKEIWKASAFLILSPSVADFASPETNPERPLRLSGGPYSPDIIENVCEHVGQATRGKSSNPDRSSAIKVPFHKSKPQRGQSPCIAKN